MFSKLRNSALNALLAKVKLYIYKTGLYKSVSFLWKPYFLNLEILTDFFILVKLITIPIRIRPPIAASGKIWNFTFL